MSNFSIITVSKIEILFQIVVQMSPNLPTCTRVEVEPLSSDDWEIIVSIDADDVNKSQFIESTFSNTLPVESKRPSLIK